MQTGKYQHYKGNYYEVFSVALHTETQQKMVVYKALYDCPALFEEYGSDPTFVRPYGMFNSDIEFNRAMVPRFTYVGD